MRTLFQPHHKYSQDQHTDENIEQDANVDQHGHLTADGQGQQQNRILNHQEPNQVRKYFFVSTADHHGPVCHPFFFECGYDYCFFI